MISFRRFSFSARGTERHLSAGALQHHTHTIVDQHEAWKASKAHDGIGDMLGSFLEMLVSSPSAVAAM